MQLTEWAELNSLTYAEVIQMYNQGQIPNIYKDSAGRICVGTERIKPKWEVHPNRAKTCSAINFRDNDVEYKEAKDVLTNHGFDLVNAAELSNLVSLKLYEFEKYRLFKKDNSLYLFVKWIGEKPYTGIALLYLGSISLLEPEPEPELELELEDDLDSYTNLREFPNEDI